MLYLQLVHIAVALAVAGPAAPPADVFAERITERAREGWRIAELQVVEDPDRAEVTLAVGMARQDDGMAERHVLVFGDGGSEVLSMRREPAGLPVERRVYPGAADLVRALAAGAPRRLYFECGDVILEAGGQSVLVEERGYYVVTGAARGAEAHRLFAEAITRSLAAGRSLATIDLPDEEGERFADLVFVDSDQEIVHAELDAVGQVVAVEVRHSPSGVAWETYRGGRKLARAVRGAEIEGVATSLADDGSLRVRLKMRGGKAFVIDLTDVQVAAVSGECPC
jgi:hypothetical protein